MRLVAIASLIIWLLPPSEGRGAYYTNTIQSFSFNPATLTITTGDTVVWVNLDATGHTVTGDAADEPFCGTGFLNLGGMCMRTFNSPGTFTYHCEPHESMIGTINVVPENIPPIVFITSPTNGASFIGPTNVLIRAVAIDPDGEVLKVNFSDGATILQSDTTEPFAVIVNLGVGRHLLTATAVDNGGEQTTSFASTVTIYPSLRILGLSVASSLVITSAPASLINVLPEYRTNLTSTTWLSLPVRSNRVSNGEVETFCGYPPGNAVFIRLRLP